VLFIDGFDMYFFGKILPAIAAGLGARPADMDVVIFWTYVGMAVGAFVMPPLADRIGARPVLALCALCFGMLSIIAVWAQTVIQMAVLRGCRESSFRRCCRSACAAVGNDPAQVARVLHGDGAGAVLRGQCGERRDRAGAPAVRLGDRLLGRRHARFLRCLCCC
jgi:MFS family permease